MFTEWEWISKLYFSVELGNLQGKDRRQAWLTESGASQDQEPTSTSPFGNITVKIVKEEMIKEKVLPMFALFDFKLIFV